MCAMGRPRCSSAVVGGSSRTRSKERHDRWEHGNATGTNTSRAIKKCLDEKKIKGSFTKHRNILNAYSTELMLMWIEVFPLLCFMKKKSIYTYSFIKRP